MCSVVILYRPGHDWPLIIGANRDEMADRPWAPPGRHWPDRANVVAGLDRLAGGSWLGINDEGVVAGVLNRIGTLGPAPGKRSRGELVLEALDHADARAAAEALADLESAAYRPFNMFVADSQEAFWLRNPASATVAWVEVAEVPAGVSMITAHDRNDPKSRRIAHYLPRFEAAPPPDPAAGPAGWSSWEGLLASRETVPGGSATDGMEIVTEYGFETVSSSLIAVPSPALVGRRPIWRFAGGRPSVVPFQDVEL